MAGAKSMTAAEVGAWLRSEGADRESLQWLVQELMEAEVSELIGSKLGERRPDDRATHRNGFRPRQ